MFVQDFEAHDIGLVLEMCQLVPVKVRGHVDVFHRHARVRLQLVPERVSERFHVVVNNDAVVAHMKQHGAHASVVEIVEFGLAKVEQVNYFGNALIATRARVQVGQIAVCKKLQVVGNVRNAKQVLVARNRFRGLAVRERKPLIELRKLGLALGIVFEIVQERFSSGGQVRAVAQPVKMRHRVCERVAILFFKQHLVPAILGLRREFRVVEPPPRESAPVVWTVVHEFFAADLVDVAGFAHHVPRVIGGVVPALEAGAVRDDNVVYYNDRVFVGEAHAVNAVAQRNVVVMPAVDKHQVESNRCIRLGLNLIVGNIFCHGFNAVALYERVPSRKPRVHERFGVVNVVVLSQIEADYFGAWRGCRQ